MGSLASRPRAPPPAAPFLPPDPSIPPAPPPNAVGPLAALAGLHCPLAGSFSPLLLRTVRYHPLLLPLASSAAHAARQTVVEYFFVLTTNDTRTHLSCFRFDRSCPVSHLWLWGRRTAECRACALGVQPCQPQLQVSTTPSIIACPTTAVVLLAVLCELNQYCTLRTTVHVRSNLTRLRLSV